MSATLKLSRPFRIVDWAFPFTIVLDGRIVGKIRNRKNTEIQLQAGTHTLRLDYYVGLKSPTVTFDVAENETADFVCHARPAATGVFWLIGSLLLQHDAWIELEGA
jgi:hypothetical protein